MLRLLLLAVSLVFAPTSARATSVFEGLGDLAGGTFFSAATAVSADGSVVVGNSNSGQLEAFRWTAVGGMVGLGDLPGGSTRSSASGVSGDGSTIVGSGQSPGGSEAYRWTSAGGMIGLGDLSPGNATVASSAQGISADGSTIVGTAARNGTSEAFRWTPAEGMVGLGSLPGLNESFAGGVSADGSVIVGTAHTNAAFLAAFRWTEDDGLIGLGNLPGDIQSHAEAVSGDGSVVGGSSQGPIEPGFNPSQAFRWSEEEGIVGLGLGNLPGRRTSHVDALSADGSIIVGGIIGDQIGQHGSVAFVWDAHRGIRLLQEVLVDDYGLDLMGWTLSGASGISADGRTIVGSGYNPDGQFEGWIAVLPEPSIGGLLALGIAGLAGKRRLFA